MNELELINAAAEMLAEEITPLGTIQEQLANPIELGRACERFASKWVGLADKGKDIYLETLFAPPQKSQA